MASKLGATFLRCSLGPVTQAGTSIATGRVVEGLSELAPAELCAAVRRGVEEVAREVGAQVAEVESLLPLPDVAEAIGRVESAQREALEAWALHTGPIGGLLKGIGDLTLDGRGPNASVFLERLSRRLVRDRALSAALKSLARELACWIEQVERCGTLLSEGSGLERARRMRRVRQIGACILAGIPLVLGCGFSLSLYMVHARVDRFLANPDPCAAASMSAEDRARASTAQRRSLDARVVACDEQKRRAQLAEEERRRREEEAQKRAREREAYERTCESLAARIDSLGPGEAPPLISQDAEALLVRIGKRKLAREDMAIQDLPCSGTRGGEAVELTFAEAVLASPSAWCTAELLSDRVRGILTRRASELPIIHKHTLGGHADDTAKKALVRGDPELERRAVRMCEIKDELGVRGGKNCVAVLSVSRRAR